MKKFIYLVFAILLVSCSSDVGKKQADFTIKAGDHRSRPLVYIDNARADGITFTFTVDESWLFPPPEKNGWSKLFGVSSGWNAHKNSARFVFKNDQRGVWVGGYCYEYGVSPQENKEFKKSFFLLRPGETYHAMIFRDKGRWEFNIDDRNGPLVFWDCPCGNMDKRLWLYKPYMGGTYTISHDWHTSITYQWIKPTESYE